MQYQPLLLAYVKNGGITAPFLEFLFLDGTDYPAWYRENGGSVLAKTIDKYCYMTCRQLPLFLNTSMGLCSKIENVNKIEDIDHPSVRATFNWAKVMQGLEIHHDDDLPARSRLGSSSSFKVSLIHALYTM